MPGEAVPAHRLLAWVGTADGEWTMVAFAETRGKARMWLAREYDVEDPFRAGFVVRRAPTMDPYLDHWRQHRDVPPEAWWKAGYRTCCYGCGEGVAQDGSCGDPECEEAHAPAVVANGHPYHDTCAPTPRA